MILLPDRPPDSGVRRIRWLTAMIEIIYNSYIPPVVILAEASGQKKSIDPVLGNGRNLELKTCSGKWLSGKNGYRL
jgi:hypothetical protein